MSEFDSPDGASERLRVLRRDLWPTVRRMVTKRGFDRSVAEDVLQETLCRFLAALHAGASIREPRHWSLRVAGRILADVGRRRPGSVGPPRASQEPAERNLGSTVEATEAGPADIALQRDLKSCLPGLLDRLPSPYRQVAHRRLIAGAARKDVSAWLRAQRPVSEEACRQVFKKTRAMVLHVVEGGDPQAEWPRRYNAAVNPWIDVLLPA